MLIPVEIRRADKAITQLMSEMREWLDHHRFEPDSFRQIVTPEGIICRLEFKIPEEADAFATAFGGYVSAE
jgi:hypothetical protein